jgi:Coenzyme PQQ synthesis protein D (PqqD)
MYENLVGLKMPSKFAFSMSSRVVATSDQVSSDLAGEVVILGLSSGVYYGLNEVGASIWNLIQQSRTIQEIQDALLQEYDVEASQLKQDIFSLLSELSAVGLIEVKDEAIV